MDLSQADLGRVLDVAAAACEGGVRLVLDHKDDVRGDLVRALVSLAWKCHLKAARNIIISFGICPASRATKNMLATQTFPGES